MVGVQSYLYSIRHGAGRIIVSTPQFGGMPTDDDFVSVVLAFPNESIAGYASRLGVSPAVVLKRLSDIPFKALLAERRAYAYYDAAAVAESSAVRAVNTIAHIMDNPYALDKDRIAAARAMVDVGVRLNQVVAVTPQIEMMRAKLEEKGLELKELKKRAKSVGRPRAVPSVIEDDPPVVMPPPGGKDEPPPVADNIMSRIQDILNRAKNAGS